MPRGARSALAPMSTPEVPVPTYVYACKDCDHRFEQYQSFSEDSLVTCPSCQHDALRKVFDTVGISFKGSGFYSTDSRRSSTASDAGSSGSSTGSTESSSTPSSGSSTSNSSSGSSDAS